MKIIYLISLVLPLTCLASDGETKFFSDKKLSFSYPPHYSVARKSGTASEECYELSTGLRDEKTLVAEVCKFAEVNPTLMDLYGFQKHQDMPDFDSKYEGYQGAFIYASPLSTYPVKESKNDYGIVFAAEDVDCDVENTQPIYRPTGICDVAFVRLNGGGGLYVNFTIQNSVERLDIATHEDFRSLLKSIRNKSRRQLGNK